LLVVFPFLFNLLPKQAYSAMAFWPFIFLKSKDLNKDLILLNHEKIHLAQQTELLVLPFYMIYLIEYLYQRLMKSNHHDAYKKISFEQEAYFFEKDLNYLKKRKLCAQFRKY